MDEIRIGNASIPPNMTDELVLIALKEILGKEPLKSLIASGSGSFSIFFPRADRFDIESMAFLTEHGGA
ncbi:UNVERIFIED_CONTAM: hypothetical protein HDU68_004824, partial [Siphonaria sp. JEL0065]